MKFGDFEYFAPKTLEAAIDLLVSRSGEAKVIAGGQSLLPAMAYRLARPSALVDLRYIDALRGVEIGPTEIRLAALTRWRDIETDARLDKAHPLMRETVRHIAHYQVRSRGTVGGSLAHADPASEFPGLAVCCDAVIEIRGASGAREVHASEFFVGPLSTVLGDDEIVVGVRFPAWAPGRRWAFKEFSKRAGDFALAGVTVFYELREGHIDATRVAVIGACSRPMRLHRIEEWLTGRLPKDETFAEAARLASEEAEPGSDIHADADYRRALVGALTRRALCEAAARVPTA